VPRSDNVLLDLNAPIFQEDLLRLKKEDALRVLGTLRKIKQLSWMDLYKDKGLHWEMVQSKTGPLGARLYTLRISQGFRALVYREDNFLRFLSLHPDHDSAYR
jgi:hypothetical protein